MNVLATRRRAILAGILVVLVLFLLRPGASRLKYRIANSISAAVARPVEIADVHVRLLPRPGFDLDNVVVYEDAAYGAEPMLRAGEVTASLRLTALLRGRLEISRLSLSEPSINLVHGSNGRWNLEALLERSAQMPLAPTGRGKPGANPGFPYIEASSARINFKQGQEKRAYALTNADFSLWQESENTWGVRLKAEPMRTDMALSDTGTVRVNGTWQRAASLRETPMQFSVEWDRPQLGQLTKFFTGSDKGWRGAVLLDATLKGTPAKLQVSTEASVRDFHRYDIAADDGLRLAAHCDAQYSSVDHLFHEVFCRAPVGSGSLTLHGSVGAPGTKQYDVALVAEDVPASAAIALAQRAKKGLPEDLSAAGTIEGTFSLRNAVGGPPQFSGQGQIGGLKLISVKNRLQIAPGDVPFEMVAEEGTSHGSKAGREGLRLGFGPFPLSSGHPAASVRGWIDRAEYRVFVSGETEIARALEAGRLFGIPTLSNTVKGSAQLNLEVSGTWWRQAATAVEFSQAQVTGSARLHDVRADVRGVDGPLEISSAEVQLTPSEVRVVKLSAVAAQANWSGSLQFPRGCGTPGACEIRFNLNTNQVRLGDVGRWVSPQPKEQPWYRALTSSSRSGPSFLANVRASGKIAIGRLQIRDVSATHVSANLSLEAGKLRLADLRAGVFGGEHRGEWQADFTTRPATYIGSGAFTAIALRRVAEAMGDGWVSGAASGNYEITASGATSADFWGSAQGTLHCQMRDGVLPHISLVNDSGPLHVELFEGKVELRAGRLELTNARLQTPSGSFGVAGTASLHRDLDLKITHSPMASHPAQSRGYAITGTIAEPEVTPIPAADTQARLKPAQQ